LAYNARHCLKGTFGCMNPFNPFSQSQQFGSDNAQNPSALTGQSAPIIAPQRGLVQFQSLLKTTSSQFNTVQAQEWWGLTNEASCPKVILEVLNSYYQELLKTSPTNPEAMVRSAWCQWRMGELLAVDGLARCQQALNIKPTDGEAWFYLAQFQRQCGLTEKAMNTIQKSIGYLSLVGKIEARKQLMSWQTVAFQQNVMTIWQWAGLQIEQRIYSLVDHWFVMAAGRWSQLQKKQVDAGLLNALSTAELSTHLPTTVDLPFPNTSGQSLLPEGYRLNSTHADVMENLTQVLTSGLQHLSETSTASNQLVSVSNSNSKAIVPIVTRSEWAMLLNKSVHGKVIRLLEQEDWEAAIPTLEDWLELHSEDTDVYFALVQACYASQRLVKGLYFCRVLLNKLPHHAKAYHAMAMIAHALDDVDGAIEAYKTAITFGLDPAWTATVARELATVFILEKQDADHSIACLKLSQELHPAELEAQFQLAELYCDLGEYHQAITTYETLAELQPTNADIYGFLGFLYWQVDRFTEAQEAYVKTIELEPTNAIAFNNLGVLHLDVYGDSAKALHQFEAATGINPHYTMAWFNQGRVFQQQGQVVRAKASYRKAQALNDGEFSELDPAELQNRLQQLGE
jgi:tetratricopeptide (TPR) repeat protein